MKRKTNNKDVVALAYFHRYGWIFCSFLLMCLFPQGFLWILSLSVIAYGLWTLVGYLCKWKHIYCSYQNAYHGDMTPNYIRWDRIKKADIYFTAIFFILAGIGCFVASFFGK